MSKPCDQSGPARDGELYHRSRQCHRFRVRGPCRADRNDGRAPVLERHAAKIRRRRESADRRGSPSAQRSHDPTLRHHPALTVRKPSTISSGLLPKSTTQARSLVLLASSIHKHQCTANRSSSRVGHNPRVLSHEARLGLCGRENTMPSRRYRALRQSNRSLRETESPKKQLACSLGYGRATEKRPICVRVMCLFHAPAITVGSKLGIFRHGLWTERLFYNLRVERL